MYFVFQVLDLGEEIRCANVSVWVTLEQISPGQSITNAASEVWDYSEF